MNAFTIIKLVAIIVALTIFLSSTITFMAESYKEYQEYYQAIMADKEYQKYIETLPLSFDGLTVTLNDGVTYYATGKARPKKEDLTVIAHFSEKGKESDRILENNEYELIVPTDLLPMAATSWLSISTSPRRLRMLPRILHPSSEAPSSV